MNTTYRRQLGTLAATVVTALGMSSAVIAQESLEQRVQRLEKQNEEIRKNAEVLQKQNETLMKLLNNNPATTPISTPGAALLTADDVRSIAGRYLEEKEAKEKAAEDQNTSTPDGGYKVGTVLNMNARWKDGLIFETPHKDFYMHIGGWFQYDSVWFTESKDLISGGKNSVGNLEDGGFFRRVRLQFDGTFWQVGEYNMIYGFENTQRSTIALFEFWGGIKDIPVLGSIRLGRMVTPQGLEGDDTTSNKAMTFLERASFGEAFYQNFSTGIWQGNSILDQRFTYSSMFYRPDLPGSNSGDFFGDGEYCVAGRLTALPIYENDGRDLVHLGASTSWRHATRGGNEVTGPQFVRFRARPEQRDFAEDIDGTSHDGVLNPGNANRLVDTGNIQANSATIIGTEFVWIRGPFSLQAEYAFTSANGAVVSKKNVGDQWFDGGYIQVSYFLTGENRTYDKRLGRFNPYYMSGPNTPFWLVRDRSGGLNWGIGAWEVAARYSHLNLNSSDNVIQGGDMNGLTLGLNWYLNPNFKIQFQYIHDNRYNVAPGVNSGSVDGFGIRTQVAF